MYSRVDNNYHYILARGYKGGTFPIQSMSEKVTPANDHC
jgi:hypothetical protein